MGRRYDPERRQRIIDAAIRIVELKGIAALSHRAVAAEADVPLGSTTYHFAGLDDLLLAALEQVSCEPHAAIMSWSGELDDDASLVDGLTRVLEEYASGGRGRIRLEYELYLAALRRPLLQPVAAAWLDDMVRVLARHTCDVATARALVALIDGLLLQFLLTDRPFDRAEVRAALSRVVGHRGDGE
ncbi:TetR/AcrR family transcriptional regulator [Streptomyces smyrnaeus]|uniref:TetR/AcrR family transcriptional regulator n=1 Tax=Streptomyces TaxID=1883 RepID=UPI000C489EC7|nr:MULTISPECIES: TetR family transcriptional regulator [unclassified Streptomyces]MBQ0865000.1 TetR family transcriptional regulator [Streptomyces sp. RK75]MBQ1123255.1 TetR family transcriptional regulator [Streptomyces sp. B15]MBQ1158283.1 TetR family transcriptional regulator [Streptomyces sp. A73]